MICAGETNVPNSQTRMPYPFSQCGASPRRVGLTFSMSVCFVQADEISRVHGFFIGTGLAINPRRWPGTSHIPAIWPAELMPHGDVLKPSGQSRVVKVVP